MTKTVKTKKEKIDKATINLEEIQKNKEQIEESQKAYIKEHFELSKAIMYFLIFNYSNNLKVKY